jgi:hypothetical protein
MLRNLRFITQSAEEQITEMIAVIQFRRCYRPGYFSEG